MPSHLPSPQYVSRANVRRVMEALLARSEVDTAGCWTWRGTTALGSPDMKLAGLGHFQARRAAWMVAHPGEPMRRHAQARCRLGNRVCVNPTHMQLRRTPRTGGACEAVVALPAAEPRPQGQAVEWKPLGPSAADGWGADVGGHRLEVVPDGRCWRLYVDGRKRAPWDSLLEAQDGAMRLLEEVAA